MRRLLAPLAALPLAWPVALPLVLGAAAPAHAETTLTIGLREDPDVLDPTLGSSYVGRIVYAAMCDKLIDIDEHLNLVPQLATAWTYEDPTHLVLTLRDGVTFQDGEKFDAEAVKYTLNRDLTMQGSMRRGEINAIEKIEVIDPLHIRLVLKAPSTPLLSMLADRAGIIVAPQAAEKAGRDFGLHPVCAGPYSFESRTPQDQIVLKRFPAYWDASHYHFDRVVYRPMPNSAVRLANLAAGSVDLVEQILPSDVPAVQKNPKLKLAIGDGLTYVGINFNLANGPLAQTDIGQNRLVRLAFEQSIDRATINQVVYNGLFTPTVQANPPSSPYYFKDLTVPPRDLDKARALLKEAGVKLPVPVTISVANSPDLQQVAEIIQSMAGEAGFDVKLKVMEFASALHAGYAGDFQTFQIGWSGRVDPDGNMWQLLHSGGTFNYGHWHNAEADSLLDRARILSDVDQRRNLYRQFWTIERHDLPLMYLWTAKNVVGMKKELTGFVQVPDGLIRLRDVRMTP